MTVVAVPVTPNLPFYNQFTVLENVTYELVFHWNDRDSHWYLDINDTSGNTVVGSTKIICNFPLIRRVTASNGPPGQLIAIDGTGQDLDPGLDDFGSRVQLLYYDSTEVGATHG